MKKRVVVTGLGVIAPNGTGKDDFWESSLAGRSGVDGITSFDVSRLHSKIAGQVKDFDPCAYMSGKIAKSVDRYAHLGLAAARMAIEDSALCLPESNRDRIGVIVGSGYGGALFREEQLKVCINRGSHRIHPLCVPQVMPNAVAGHISIEFGLRGQCLLIATACASGSHAIGEAFRKIQHGEADVILSGGAEAPLTEYTFGAFCSLRVLSSANRPPHEASRPFDGERDGFVLGDGAAILVMEELEHALERGAHIYAEIIGYGATSGAYHLVIPQPDGEDAARTMRITLEDAKMAPADIDYVNAHGTGTRANDVAETKAIKSIFGSHAPHVPISSMKSMTGHSIGAASAIEAAACCLTIERQVIHPTINHTTPDPECDLDYVPNISRHAEINTVMSNSFGFGSHNACIIFKKID